MCDRSNDHGGHNFRQPKVREKNFPDREPQGPNVQGAKCPRGQMSKGPNVQKAQCPRGPMSKGPNVSVPIYKGSKMSRFSYNYIQRELNAPCLGAGGRLHGGSRGLIGLLCMYI